MRSLNLFFTVFTCFTCISVCPAQDDYSFSTFTAANGLVSSEIYTLFQDNPNYLWIGHSAGVSRFDGNQFENFLFASDHQVGKTYSIAEDKNGHLWIGSELGLFLWKDEQLHFITTGKFNRPVYALQFDNDGGLWLGNSDGPYYIPGQQCKLIVSSYQTMLSRFQLSAWKQRFHDLHEVKFISAADDGAIYFSDGIAVYQLQHNKIIPVWKSTGRMDRLNGIHAWNKDTVFICSLSKGIMALEHLQLRKGKSNAYHSKQMLVKDKRFFVLTNDGIYETDPVSLSSKKMIHLPEFANTWGICFLEDSEQNFWIGSFGQLNYATKNFFTNVPTEKNEALRDFYSIFQLKNKEIVFGSNQGETFKKSKPDEELKMWKKLFPHSAVTAFHELDDGRLWVASSYEGLALIDKGKIKRFTKAGGLRDNTNFLFLENNKKELFTAGDAGVTQIVQLKNGEVKFKNFVHHTGSSDYIIIKAGIVSQNGRMFFGSNRGFFELQNDSLHSIRIKGTAHQKHNITDIEMDGENNIWISTLGDGILICAVAKDGLQLKHKLTTKEGLPTQVILQLLTDRKGQLWAADYNSIFRIIQDAPGRYAISEYKKNQSWFSSPYYSLQMLQANDGKIWLASSSGIVNFDSERTKHEFVPKIHLSRVILFDKTKAIDTPGLQSGFTLQARANAISFQYRGIRFPNSGDLRYSFRLVGSDSLWTDPGRSQTATFRNLSPGNYSFQVKASSEFNQWSQVAQYDFKIEPRLWNNLWFIIASGIAVAALLFILSARWRKKIQTGANVKVRAQQVIADNLQYRLETEKIINYFAISILEKQTVDELVWDVSKNCISQLGFEDCVIYLKDETRDVLIQKAAWGPKTNQENMIINPIEIPMGKGIAGNVALNKKAEIVNDVSLDARYIIDDVQRSSEICVPILAEGKLLGVIDSEHSQKNFYTPRHLQILSTIASLCADKIVIIKTVAEKRRAEIEVMKNKQKATEARLQSMRLQMNPHFLFNALNSIQQMILTGDETVATRSLSKFSRLLRTVLIQSDKEKISLSKELEILQLYIELESLRFEETFEYSIYCDPKIDKEETQIPTLLVQPFVENAIWHGLMHKQGIRKLSIQFTEENSLIVCSIEDNGIGRFASQHIKEDSVLEGKHTGKAIALAEERLKIFGEFSNSESNLRIIDEKDASGNASGTKVIIKFPA